MKKTVVERQLDLDLEIADVMSTRLTEHGYTEARMAELLVPGLDLMCKALKDELKRCEYGD